MTTPFRAPAVMPHSPDGNMTYEIFKYVLADPGLTARTGLDEATRLEAVKSEESAQVVWKRLLDNAAQTGTSLSLAANNIPVNHLIVPDLTDHDGLIPPDPNGTPFIVPERPVDDPSGGISYDRWKTLIANPETRQMLGLDDKTASWIMRSEEGAFMLYQQGLANENQEAELQSQDVYRQVETQIKKGFGYGGWAIGILLVVIVLSFVLG